MNSSKKIILFPVSVEELQNIISEAVKTEIGKLPKVNHSDQFHEFISRKEAAKFLKISLPTLTDYIMRSIIPAYRIGNNVRLRKDEVVNSLVKIDTIKHRKIND